VHYVNKIELYKQSFLKCFERFYGSPGGYCFLALLPDYLQRSGSSLVYMCNELIRQSGDAHSGFYLDNFDALISTINQLNRSGRKTILLGVSYALMDLADKNIALSDNFIVMETGGMKGRRRELVKQELHAYLKKGFGLQEIHSEYGMTELLSQAYSRKDGLFEAPPWMRFLTREVGDPLKLRNDSRTGGINVIDLANLYSCAFIATGDLGRLHPDGKLELMGRFDHSDVRGCNLMMEIN
jgi:acyl-CoA synthetase (AMP-forming)/AMP-acid ligase II